MKLVEVCVKTYSINKRFYYKGEILFDCGIRINEIHFSVHKNDVYINYPAVRDKNHYFHPSFCIVDLDVDTTVKNILRNAWQKMNNNGKNEIYGYRKKVGNEQNGLSVDDFEWMDDKLENEYRFSNLQEIPARVELLPDKRCQNKLKHAYCKVYFNDYFVINNVEVFLNQNGNIAVQLPKIMYNEVVIFMSKEDKNWVESNIIKQFQNIATQFDQEMENITDEDRLFRILWNASDNGYILQSEIRGILERNQLDWKKIFHVDKISQLVAKMNFMSVRRLELSPEHFANWVAISYEKDPESLVVTKENVLKLPDRVKKELHNALAEEYRRNGKIDLSRVIPYMMEKHPSLLEKLPKPKLKTILQNCDFVQFEGGPTPPIYVHILDEDSANALNDYDRNVSVLKIDEDELGPEFTADTSFIDAMSEDQNNLQTESIKLNIKEKDEYYQPAKNNPFAFIPNTKFIQEQNIPGTALPKITTSEAMKKFLIMENLGQLESMDLEIVYWISNLQYSKSTFLYDLISGGFIALPNGKNINRDKLNTKLMRLYKTNLISFYKLCSVDEDGNIISKSSHRILVITSYGRTQLRMIGRQSNFDLFMTVDNIEKILNKLSINQWFTKFITIFKNAIYNFDTIVTAKIAEANAARIPLIIDIEGVSVFVSAIKKGEIHRQDIRSGEFAFWIKRVSDLINNYNELYVNCRKIVFKKRPKLIFICEDLEHCLDIYKQLLSIASKMGDATILDSFWFADDLDIYNDFLHAHYSFDSEDRQIFESIDDFLGVKISANSKEKTDIISEQNQEDDMRILEKLDYEEKQMLQPLVE